MYLLIICCILVLIIYTININMSIFKLIQHRVLKYLLYLWIITFIIIIFDIYVERVSFYIDLKPFFWEISKILNYPILSFWDKMVSFFSISTFVFTVFLWLSIWKYYQKFIYSIKKKNKSISNWTVTILANLGYYIIIIVVLLLSLKVIWIDLSNLTMIVSALSVGIGFGLQTIVSNFISGMILMFEQSIKTWDYIELWEWLKWTVESINMRSTTIRTTNNVNIIVPNQSFIQNNIINWSLWDNRIRIQIPFWVSYWTSFESVEDVVLWTLLVSDLDFIRDDDLFPSIVMTEMWTSSVNYLLNIWIDSDDLSTPTATKWLFMRLVYKALNENNFTIPFPQTDLHIKESIPLEIRLITDK